MIDYTRANDQLGIFSDIILAILFKKFAEKLLTNFFIFNRTFESLKPISLYKISNLVRVSVVRVFYHVLRLANNFELLLRAAIDVDVFGHDTPGINTVLGLALPLMPSEGLI